MTVNISAIVDARNKATFDTVFPKTGSAGAVGATGATGPAGQDLTGPLNIDGGKPQSFYAGLASVDAGYYNETYGGMLYGLDGGTP